MVSLMSFFVAWDEFGVRCLGLSLGDGIRRRSRARLVYMSRMARMVSCRLHELPCGLLGRIERLGDDHLVWFGLANDEVDLHITSPTSAVIVSGSKVDPPY